MAKNINAFIKELAEYINNHIVGTENTYIKRCNVSDNVRNRGHIIPMELVMPEDIKADEETRMGPAFYAEELLEEFPKHTIAFIAETLNARVNEFYPAFVNTMRTQLAAMMRTQLAAMEKSIDDYDKNDLILTAIPTALCNAKEIEPFISRREDTLGLTLMLKSPICEAANAGQVYFATIPKMDGHEVTKEHWETAAKNSFQLTNIDIKLMPAMTPLGESNMPVFGSITDTNGFYDFFYLLSPEYVWSGAKKSFGADKIYIIPNGAYSAIFILDNEAIRADNMANTMAKNLLKKGVNDLKNKPLPVFVLDCNTLTISRYKE